MPDIEEPTNLSEYEELLGEAIPVVNLHDGDEEPKGNQVAPDESSRESATLAQADPKAEIRALAEARDAEKRRADEIDLHNRQLQLAYFQAVQNAQRNALPGQKPEINPELEEVGKFLAPWFQQQVQPLVQTIQQQQQMIAMLQGNQKVAEAFDYVRSSVPGFNELLPDLEKWLDAKPEHIRQRITADPDLIINEALIVRELKQRGGEVSKPPIKSDVRDRARVEGPGPGTSPVQKTNDYSNLSEAEFGKLMGKMGFY